MKKVKIMVFGTFDILHLGHLNFLKQAKKYGDYLIIVVARDKTVKKVKGKKPKKNEKIRLAEIKKLKIADRVVLGDLKNKLRIVYEFKPDIICLGYDQKNFVALLKKIKFPLKIVRLKPYQAKEYKSSKLNKDFTK